LVIFLRFIATVMSLRTQVVRIAKSVYFNINYKKQIFGNGVTSGDLIFYV
jgi:hypothetical protein